MVPIQSLNEILMNMTEPSLNQCYAMIMEEETHRFVSDSKRHGFFLSTRGSGSSSNMNVTGQFQGNT